MTPVAVNLSTRCLLDPQLPDDVGALLSAHGLAGSELDLEITESAIMADPERAAGHPDPAGRRSASGSRSTTSAPATRRWPT